MIKPFLFTNSLFGYVDGTIPYPQETNTTTTYWTEATSTEVSNPSYVVWIANDVVTSRFSTQFFFIFLNI